MLAINKKWVIFSMVLWLLCCQGLFVLIQESSGEKTIGSVQNQLRQELDFSDFHFLARSISDFTSSGSIKCSILEKVSPDFIPIIDLSYMEPNCSVSKFLLEGSFFDVKLKTLNGDLYRLRFISTNTLFFTLALWGFRILGILAIIGIITSLELKAQRDLIKHQVELDLVVKMKEMAMQVSHDIRSPLATLKVAIFDIENINDQHKKIIHSSLDRIDSIANDLLNNEKKKINGEVSLSEVDLIPTIFSIVSEKQVEFRHRENINIEFHPENSLPKLVINLNQVEFKRLFSNLINNAIEALDSNATGKILVQANLSGNDLVVITISDNGKGIPADIIKKLGTKGFSHGKESHKSGSGLGLFHANKMINSFGGSFEIESLKGQGTLVKIFLPCDFSSKIEKNASLYDCVYIDDDQLMLMTWEWKAKNKNINLLTLKSPKDFDMHIANIDKEQTTIYIDSELGANEVKGEVFAESLFNEGYKKIVIASGYSNDNFSHLPWLACVGKKCPF